MRRKDTRIPPSTMAAHMEQALDVDYRRTVEWLSERRKVPNDWNQRLRGLTLKQKDLLHALETAPEAHLRESVVSDLPGYLQARATLTRLEATPEAAKGRSLLGNWQSTPLHNWTRLVQLYEKDSLQLADCGKQLRQVGGYDLPALKQQLSQCERQVQDETQRETSLLESAERTKKQFRDQCGKLGIQGVQPRQELKVLTRKLPELYREAHGLLLGGELGALVEQYRSVTLTSHGAQVSLPALEELSAMGELKVEFEALQDHYAPLIAVEGDLELEGSLPEGEEKEWKIDVVGSGEAAKASVTDYPYADRSFRNRLITDLEELEAFYEARKAPQACISRILSLFQSAQSLLLMREQPSVLESILAKLEELQRDKVTPQLASLRKATEETRASARQIAGQIKAAKDTCRKLIEVLNTGIPLLFTGVRVRVIGDIMRDLAQN